MCECVGHQIAKLPDQQEQKNAWSRLARLPRPTLATQPRIQVRNWEARLPSQSFLVVNRRRLRETSVKQPCDPPRPR